MRLKDYINAQSTASSDVRQSEGDAVLAPSLLSRQGQWSKRDALLVGRDWRLVQRGQPQPTTVVFHPRQKVYGGERLNLGQTISWVAASCPGLPEASRRFSVSPSTIQGRDKRNCWWRTLLQTSNFGQLSDSVWAGQGWMILLGISCVASAAKSQIGGLKLLVSLWGTTWAGFDAWALLRLK